MYKIMLVAKEGSNVMNTAYQFMTDKDEYGNTIIYEAKSLAELDKKVEEMLNGRYAKKDFIIVQTKDYTIDSDITKSSESTQETE